jgi:hypothetical protein
VRQDIVDTLVDLVTSVDHALAVVVGDHGMGKSYLMAAVGVTVELEVPGAILCPLFVGSCAGSRDSRLLLKVPALSLSLSFSRSLSLSLSLSPSLSRSARVRLVCCTS